MQIQKDFEYYHNLHRTVTHALLHLLCHVSASQRYVPTSKRNEILVKYLKAKTKDKHLANIAYFGDCDRSFRFIPIT